MCDARGVKEAASVRAFVCVSVCLGRLGDANLESEKHIPKRLQKQQPNSAHL